MKIIHFIKIQYRSKCCSRQFGNFFFLFFNVQQNDSGRGKTVNRQYGKSLVVEGFAPRQSQPKRIRHHLSSASSRALILNKGWLNSVARDNGVCSAILSSLRFKIDDKVSCVLHKNDCNRGTVQLYFF